MDSAGKRHRGRAVVILLALNLLVLVLGLASEYWGARSHDLPSVNADKILLTGAQGGFSKER